MVASPSNRLEEPPHGQRAPSPTLCPMIHGGGGGGGGGRRREWPHRMVHGQAPPPPPCGGWLASRLSCSAPPCA
jgi:hypothetical protein